MYNENVFHHIFLDVKTDINVTTTGTWKNKNVMDTGEDLKHNKVVFYKYNDFNEVLQ